MDECCAGTGNMTLIGSDGWEGSIGQETHGEADCLQYCFATWPWPEDDRDRARAILTWQSCIGEHGFSQEDGDTSLQCVSHPDAMPPPDLFNELEDEDGDENGSDDESPAEEEDGNADNESGDDNDSDGGDESADGSNGGNDNGGDDENAESIGIRRWGSVLASMIPLGGFGIMAMS